MKGDPRVVDILNTVLTNELTAINQYFLHARTLDHWGVTKFGKLEYKESIEEMRHADDLIKRILFLDGLPNVQRLNPIMIGQSPEEVLRCDLKLEEKAIADLREGIGYCEQVRDFVSQRPAGRHPARRGAPPGLRGDAAGPHCPHRHPELAAAQQRRHQRGRLTGPITHVILPPRAAGRLLPLPRIG